MKNKLTYAFLLVTTLAVILTGCDSIITSSATYYGGDINASFGRTKTEDRWGQTSDWMKLEFSKPGKYQVAFTATPEKDNGEFSVYMPNSFTVEAKEGTVYHIKQNIMPPYVRMTITREGEEFSETHDFE